MRTDPALLDDETLQRLGQRVSIREALLWTLGFSVAFALPRWMGLSALPLAFYGTLAAVTWRLARALPFRWALGISIVLAVCLTVALMLLVL
jgi:hypothetical protein